MIFVRSRISLQEQERKRDSSSSYAPRILLKRRGGVLYKYPDYWRGGGMTEEIVVPPEVKREMGLSSLWSLWIATLAMIGDSFAGFSYGVPWEKFMAGIKTICQALAGQGTKIILENFKIPGNDCTTVAKVHHISSDAMGFNTEIIEMTPEKAVVHAKRCLAAELFPSMFPNFLDAPVEELPCKFFDDATGKTVNPKITHRFGETFCKGGKICENIWEVKE